jgi:hypothetical protein
MAVVFGQSDDEEDDADTATGVIYRCFEPKPTKHTQ